MRPPKRKPSRTAATGQRALVKRSTGTARPASAATSDGSTIGNRATALMISRDIGSAAEDLHEAMDGLGTDEDAVYAALGSHPGSAALRARYQQITGRSLLADLRDEMSGSELDRALRLYYGHSSASWDTAVRMKNALAGLGTDENVVFEILRAGTSDGLRSQLRTAYRDLTGHALETDLRDDLSGDELSEALLLFRHGPLPDLPDAVRLRNAMAGMGTDEEAVYRMLSRRTDPASLQALCDMYARLTGRTLENDIRDDFSGGELTRALQLLGIGTFENVLPQDMFEGKTTVVRGRFEWRFEDGELKVVVRADFEPDEGVTAPLATWQSQIDNVWNQYALQEPGGLKVPITMSLVDDSDGKTIRVVENETPGTYGGGDRANAGKWYPVMPSDTAPHEFGHLIGLPDEYQRKHPDFVEITGAAPAGPTNTSGKTNAEIAEELHTALTGDDEATRAADATAVLNGVGLISGGMVQQGDFAQAVMAAYDAENSPNLQDTLASLPRDGRWTLQSVFSYASGTVMGNPGVVPHEHPVDARHLREFVNIAQTRFPTYTWTTGPR